MAFDLSNFKEVIEMIPKLQESVALGINREFQKKKGKEKVIKMDRSFIHEVSTFLYAKWTIDILFMIFFQDNLYYNDLRKSLPEINTRTLSTRLKQIEEKRLVERIVHTGKPVRVSYKITTFGKNLICLFFPSFIYIILERDEDVLKSN
ncbi:MAG: winged helix-turn-helix transcriptional regulator [Candidatus Odinarchaeota archaeon]